MKQKYPTIEREGRFHDMVTRLRRITQGTSNLDPVEVVEARHCTDCDRPECDAGCIYAPKGKPMTHIVPPRLPSIHDPIVPFGAPTPRPTISDAFRNAGKDVASAIDHMIATCEEARQEGLKLIEALNESGQWHDEFLANYVNVQTQAAAVMRDAWKDQIEELRRQRAALTQSTPQAHGEQS